MEHTDSKEPFGSSHTSNHHPLTGPSLQHIGSLQVTSFREISFESEEMKKLLDLDVADHVEKKHPPVRYDANALMPEWILNNPEWKNTKCDSSDNNLISDILQIPFAARSQEQSTVLVKWLMSVWEIANTMGFKRCVSMTEAMQYSVFEPNKHIVTEGDRGLVFYIIVSGTTNIHKEGIGNVAQLTKGQSFGELALTQGKDLRSASVIAQTRTEVLCLHKRDYDHFVRDIQLGERRENFQAIRSCKLFEHWGRNKIERMCNTAMRKTFKEGSYIFRQGDPPDSLYLVAEGALQAVRDVETVITNRWPSGKNRWTTVSKKHVKSVFVKDYQKGDYFGELSIIKNDVRRAHVIAKTRCVLLTIDKLDFLHLLRHKNAIKSVMTSAEEYAEVNRAIDGSPSCSADTDDHSYDSPSETSDRPHSPLKLKNAVTRAFKLINPGGGGARPMSESRKRFVESVESSQKLHQQQRASSPKKIAHEKLKHMPTVQRMTASRSSLVKHNANETIGLFRAQLNSMGPAELEVDEAAPQIDLPAVQAAHAMFHSGDSKKWRNGVSYHKSLSFDSHSVVKQEKSAPIVFAPVSELATINEEKAKNRVLIDLDDSRKTRPINVTVTTVVDVTPTGRRQKSVCVKNVKDLIYDTQKMWAAEVAASPGVSEFRRQSSANFLSIANEDCRQDRRNPIGSPTTRRLSSFAEASEDVERSPDGALHLRSLKVVPPEFQKPINERSKLTFYEVMSNTNDHGGVVGEDHLPSVYSPKGNSLSTTATGAPTLFSPARLTSQRRESSHIRPHSSPTRKNTLGF